MNVPVIDIHAHIWPDTLAPKAVFNLAQFYRFPADGEGTASALLREMDRSGVAVAVLHNVAMRPEQVPKLNDWIAPHAGERFVCFAAMHPDYPAPEEELERCAYQLGLKGLKMHSDFQQVAIDDPRMMRLYAVMERLRLPVILHMGDPRMDYSAPERLLPVLERFPELTVIAAHFGGYGVWERARCLFGHPRVYLDTSSALWAIPTQQAYETIQAHGVERVLFGSDYPVVHDYVAEMHRFDRIPLTEEERRLILHDNAASLLGLE